MGRAAALAPGHRVLSLACGAGDELALWVQTFGVATVAGTEPDAEAARLARRFVGQRVSVTASPPAGPFDAVVCVDAAYHLSPRTGFLAQAFAVLRPGGRLAFTDLVLDGRASPLLRGAARLCGVQAGDLTDVDTRLAQLRAAGFDRIEADRLDDAVLAGFAAFARQQRGRLGREAWAPGWRRVAVTAALVAPCRAAGLGYALYAARKPD